MARVPDSNKAGEPGADKTAAKRTVYVLELGGKEYRTTDKGEALNRVRTQGAVLKSPKEIG